MGRVILVADWFETCRHYPKPARRAGAAAD